MDLPKQQFVTKKCLPLFNSLQADTSAAWGKMNAQQMIEHVIAFYKISTGKLKFDLITPVEHLPKYREFLLSDSEFRENTKAPGKVLGDEPLPLRFANMEEALFKLEDSVAEFEAYFKDDESRRTLHPVFGELNYDEWVLLHYKHLTHHLRQFGLM